MQPLKLSHLITLETHVNIMLFVRLDTGMDHRVNKEEFTSPKMKETIEKVNHGNLKWNSAHHALFLSSGWDQSRTWGRSLTRSTRTEADRSSSESSWTGRWRRISTSRMTSSLKTCKYCSSHSKVKLIHLIFCIFK